jgi:hypothetical protein
MVENLSLKLRPKGTVGIEDINCLVCLAQVNWGPYKITPPPHMEEWCQTVPKMPGASNPKLRNQFFGGTTQDRLGKADKA